MQVKAKGWGSSIWGGRKALALSLMPGPWQALLQALLHLEFLALPHDLYVLACGVVY